MSNGSYIHLTNDTTGTANSDGVSISLLQDELYIVNRETSGTIKFEIGSNKGDDNVIKRKCRYLALLILKDNSIYIQMVLLVDYNYLLIHRLILYKEDFN